MNKRTFLRNAAGLFFAPLAGRLLAAPAAGKSRFLLVFLRGGYDAANVLIPVSSGFYYESRPNIAVARESALPLTSEWGLHPALGDTVYKLYQNGQAAFIPFAGTEDLSRSHFETQDAIELGQGAEDAHNFQSGFLNRLASVLGASEAALRPRAMAFTDQLPLVFRGEAQVANMGLRFVGKPAVDARQSALITAMYRGTPLAAQVNEGFAMRDDVMRDMMGEMEGAGRNAVSARGFEVEARRVAKLMKEQFNVGFVDVGGWDTHVGEGGASGFLATRLEELGRGLAAFADEQGPAWQDTVVVLISEFGRTFRENGNRGTDHGHGTVFWVLGGGIRGGRIAGDQVLVRQETLFQNRDYAVLNEYRGVLGGLFARMYGLDDAQLERIFPGAKLRDFALV